MLLEEDLESVILQLFAGHRDGDVGTGRKLAVVLEQLVVLRGEIFKRLEGFGRVLGTCEDRPVEVAHGRRAVRACLRNRKQRYAPIELGFLHHAVEFPRTGDRHCCIAGIEGAGRVPLAACQCIRRGKLLVHNGLPGLKRLDGAVGIDVLVAATAHLGPGKELEGALLVGFGREGQAIDVLSRIGQFARVFNELIPGLRRLVRVEALRLEHILVVVEGDRVGRLRHAIIFPVPFDRLQRPGEIILSV